MKRLLAWFLAATVAHGTGCSRQEAPERRAPKRDSDAGTTVVDAGSPAPGPSLGVTTPEPATPERAVMAFAMDLHRVWRADKVRRGKTAVLSPLSLAGALALLREGARGETRDELDRALHLSSRVSASALVGLESRGAAGFEIWRGQRAFVDGRLPLQPSFRAHLQAHQGGSIAPADFRDPEGARTGINRWVEDVTHRRILQLLPPGSIGPKTRLILVDALSASARWASPFDPSKTRTQAFTALDGSVESVPMMVGESRQPFTHSDTYDAVDFACADQEHALLVVAPAPGHFDEIDASLDLARLDGIVASLVLQRVVVAMPRFQAALPATSLITELQALGLEHLFDESANLEGISSDPDAKLHVADALHAARIDVDESGARVAAATGVVIDLPSPKVSITLDRPFFFWLRNVRTGTPIVMGRYMGPSQR